MSVEEANAFDADLIANVRDFRSVLVAAVFTSDNDCSFEFGDSDNKRVGTVSVLEVHDEPFVGLEYGADFNGNR